MNEDDDDDDASAANDDTNDVLKRLPSSFMLALCWFSSSSSSEDMRSCKCFLFATLDLLGFFSNFFFVEYTLGLQLSATILLPHFSE